MNDTKRRRPGMTREELVKHKIPIHTLSAPVRGWVVDARGNVGEDVTIPAGARMVSITREACRMLLATYGDDRGVADVIFPDGRHESVFFRLTDASRSLPEDVPDVEWRSESQTYELVEAHRE